VKPTEAGVFLMPKVASARVAQPGCWWWSRNGNVRIRCPLCSRPYRLEVAHRRIEKDGSILFGIVHRVRGCRERYIIMQLKGWSS
jgi:hypothetical protein